MGELLVGPEFFIRYALDNNLPLYIFDEDRDKFIQFDEEQLARDEAWACDDCTIYIGDLKRDKEWAMFSLIYQMSRERYVLDKNAREMYEIVNDYIANDFGEKIHNLYHSHLDSMGYSYE